MKLSFSLLLGALGSAQAEKGALRAPVANVISQLKIDNTVYVGTDLGMSCDQLGVERVAQSSGTPLVYCFQVTNTGTTHMKDVVITNKELNDFFDNSIGSLAPGASKLVTYDTKLYGDLVNNAVVTGTPADSSGKALPNFEQVTASDPSIIVDVVARARNRKLTSNAGYASPIDHEDGCIQTKWEEAGNDDFLVCSGSDAYLFSLASDEDKTCIAGEKITLSIDAAVAITKDTLFDLGWYISTSGGDAMTGSSCIVNGLQEGNKYDVMDLLNPAATAGTVQWSSTGGGGGDPDFLLTDDGGFAGSVFDSGFDDGGFGDPNGGFGDPNDPSLGGGTPDDGGFGLADDQGGSIGDNDVCGDIESTSESGSLIPMPILVEAEMLCEDGNDDGKLDFAICFTWRTEAGNDGQCTFDNNVPETLKDGCYCTRYDVPNVEVIQKDTTPTSDC